MLYKLIITRINLHKRKCIYAIYLKIIVQSMIFPSSCFFLNYKSINLLNYTFLNTFNRFGIFQD
jgi:hypothetical protein